MFRGRTRRPSARDIRARRRELLKAGYLEAEEFGGKNWPSEITRLDNSQEAGLLLMKLKTLRELHILSGRENHVAHIMRSKHVSREAARRLARRDFYEWGGTVGNANDYVAYYYKSGR